MSDAIAPQKTVQFTITKAPTQSAPRKTIRRLMEMQPDVRRGLKMLARRRRQTDNILTTRAGRPWVQRVRATRLVQVEAGETFTLTLTPQMIPDIRSVERYLDAKPA